MNHVKYFLLPGVVLLFALGFQNCSGVSFDQGAADSTTGSTGDPNSPDGPDNQVDDGIDGESPLAGGSACTFQQSIDSGPTKVILVLDQSWSNNLTGNSFYNVNDSTDRGRVFRTQAVQSLVNQNPASENLQYGMFGFYSYASSVYLSYWVPRFASDDTILLSALSDFSSLTGSCAEYSADDPRMYHADCGGTPYEAAFRHAESLIDANDGFRYSIIFISDGLPDGATNGAPTGTVRDEIMNAVSDTMNAKPGSVAINTVYYHSNGADANAVEFLRDVAIAGQGDALAVNTANQIDLSSQIRVRRGLCD